MNNTDIFGLFPSSVGADWSSEERTHLLNSYIIRSTWRVHPDLTDRGSLIRDQAELGLLFSEGYTTSEPETLDVAQLIALSSRSLFHLCSTLGLGWIIRVSDHYEGAIGALGSRSWGLIIEGSENETRECIAYVESGHIVYIEALPELIRPQIISASLGREKVL